MISVTPVQIPKDAVVIPLCRNCSSAESVFEVILGDAKTNATYVCKSCLQEVSTTIQQLNITNVNRPSFQYTIGQQTKPLLIEALHKITKENYELKEKINVKEKEKLLLTHEEQQIESWKEKIQTNVHISNTIHYIGEQLTIAESISLDETTYQLIRTKLKP